MMDADRKGPEWQNRAVAQPAHPVNRNRPTSFKQEADVRRTNHCWMVRWVTDRKRAYAYVERP